MTYSIDVDGNDNQPEWGYCTYPGCTHAALPIWLSGSYPDDADLFLCEDHIGSKINALMVLLRTAVDMIQSNYVPDSDFYARARRELGDAAE